MQYNGTPVSAGVAVGAVCLYRPFVPQVDDHTVSHEEISTEIEHYHLAVSRAKAELVALQGSFLEENDQDKANMFGAHLEILFDETMDEDILVAVEQQQLNGTLAIHAVYENYIALFEQIPDPLIRERSADLRDVRTRLLRCWQGLPEQNLSRLTGPVVVVAHDLLPSDTATLDRDNVLAIVTEIGGSTSHTAIIARSYEIPAILGIKNILCTLSDGQRVVVDAVDGTLLTEFTPEEELFYQDKGYSVRQRQAEAKRYLPREAVTTDGVRVEVELNIASATPDDLDGAKYTDGVGLFRSEFLYMGRNELPSEEEQYQVYKKVLLTYGSRPVILRTLDIGGDKPLSCINLPKEDNPFLGNRALRLCLSHPDIFQTQLRAVLRASVHGNLWLMFPMVASIDDIRRAKACVIEAMAALDKLNTPYRKDIKLGIMIEIPSIALLADQAAQEVDFASIGTNDLIQYSTAVDRGNPAVSSYYQSYHPGLFRLIGYVVSAFSAQGKPVGVCGEMGGDPLAAAVLLGLGMRRFSMSFSSVAPIKKLICSLSIAEAADLAREVCGLPTADDVKQCLSQRLSSIIT